MLLMQVQNILPTHNYKAGIGFDLSTIAGWSIIANYEIENSNGNGNTDNL